MLYLFLQEELKKTLGEKQVPEFFSHLEKQVQGPYLVGNAVRFDFCYHLCMLLLFMVRQT